MTSSEANVTSRATPLGENDPRTLGTYTLLGKLGQGGMGTVYLGRSELGRLVAIKVVRADVADDPQFRGRFRQEAATARREALADGCRSIRAARASSSSRSRFRWSC